MIIISYKIELISYTLCIFKQGSLPHVRIHIGIC